MVLEAWTTEVEAEEEVRLTRPPPPPHSLKVLDEE